MEHRLLTPRTNKINLSMNSELDSEGEQQLEVEIYKTEQELDGQFTGSTMPTPMASVLSSPETLLKRAYDKIVTDNAEKERKLALLISRLDQSSNPQMSNETSFKSYYEDELAKLKSRHDTENFQTKQLNLLIKRDQASIIQLKDQVNRVEEMNRRLKAPLDKSEKTKLVAVNSMTTLLNDKVHFIAEATQRRNMFYELRDHQEEIRAKTADKVRHSIEQISRYKLKFKVKAEVTSKLKELLSQGLTELTTSKQLNSDLTGRINKYCIEMSKIMHIMEAYGKPLTGSLGIAPSETEALILCFKQMVDKELSLKCQFSFLSTEAEKKRQDCFNIREELTLLKAAYQTQGPRSQLPSSVNMIKQDLQVSQSLDSKDTHLRNLETTLIRVLFCVLELLERILLAMKCIKGHTKLPDEILDLIETFKASVIKFRGNSRADIPQRRRANSLVHTARSRESTFKTEVNLVQSVANTPLSLNKLRDLILKYNPTYACELEAMLASLRQSKIFLRFLNEAKVLDLFDQGVSLKDFPTEGLNLAHSEFHQYLELIVQTYVDFHNELTKKTDLLKSSVEKIILKNYVKLKFDPSISMQLSSTMPILKALTTKTTQKSSSRLLKSPTTNDLAEEIHEPNSDDEKLAQVQRQIKQNALSSLPKKPLKIAKKLKVIVPMSASCSRLTSFSTNLLREMRSYDTKLAQINLCQKRLMKSPSCEVTPHMSPRPKFMRVASMMGLRRTHSRQASIFRPDLN